MILAMEFLGSVRLDARELDHLSPFFGFIDDELCKLQGGTRKHGDTEVGKPGLNVGIGHRPDPHQTLEVGMDDQPHLTRENRLCPAQSGKFGHPLRYATKQQRAAQAGTHRVKGFGAGVRRGQPPGPGSAIGGGPPAATMCPEVSK
jgi:hypothetical protein